MYNKSFDNYTTSQSHLTVPFSCAKVQEMKGRFLKVSDAVGCGYQGKIELGSTTCQNNIHYGYLTAPIETCGGLFLL
jgi:hypothetical protein